LRSKIATGLLLTLGFCHGTHAQTWERLGPEGGMVVSLEVSPGGDVYLGTADGHVFASKDRGRSWELRGRVGSRLDAVLTRLVMDKRAGKKLFAAVWYQEAGAGGGVFRSEDGGRHWELVGLEGEAVRALEIAPSQPEELVAGTRSGVFRSVDGGKRWERISPAGDEELRNVDSLAIDPRDAEVIYAGTYHLPWRTQDGGKTWKPASAGMIDDSDVMSVRLDATNPDRVYLSACSGIYRSENRGGEWAKLQGIPYAARRTQAIVQDPGSPKTLYAGTTEGLWVTRDGGESWTRTTPRDWVVNSLVVLGDEGGGAERVVLGTEGQGIEVSDDAGANFAESNRGFAHVIVKQLLSAQSPAGGLLMVVERDGLQILESGDEGKSWAPLSFGAGEHGKTTRLNADRVQEFYASPWGWLLRLDDGELWMWEVDKKEWKEWKLRMLAAKPLKKAGRAAQPAKSENVRPLVAGGVIAFSQNVAVVSTRDGLMRCSQSGICSALKAFAGGGQVRAIWQAYAGQGMCVVMDGKLGWSPDGEKTAAWQDLPVAKDQALWLDMVESGTSKTLYLGTTQGLFLSRDTGAHWSRTEDGLPAGQVERWLRSPGVWLLSERGGGIYVSEDEGVNWRRVDQDAERGRITGFVGIGSGTILAGSQSEGLLRLRVAGRPETVGNPQ
jgi:photosystem II stability/assembly factor-like uncharacterized protein